MRRKETRISGVRKFSKEAIWFANKSIWISHKPIHFPWNPFNWFLNVCSVSHLCVKKFPPDKRKQWIIIVEGCVSSFVLFSSFFFVNHLDLFNNPHYIQAKHDGIFFLSSLLFSILKTLWYWRRKTSKKSINEKQISTTRIPEQKKIRKEIPFSGKSFLFKFLIIFL